MDKRVQIQNYANQIFDDFLFKIFDKQVINDMKSKIINEMKRDGIQVNSSEFDIIEDERFAGQIRIVYNQMKKIDNNDIINSLPQAVRDQYDITVGDDGKLVFNDKS
jgi:hypothetical protein